MSTDPLARRVALSGETMGTRYSCVFHAPAPQGHEALHVALHAAVGAVDAAMSNWKPASDISRLNRAPVGAWVEIPESLNVVLGAALAIEAASCGAFDIGISERVAAWGFGPDAVPAGLPRTAPPPRPVTRQALELDPRAPRARKHAPLRLDLSGIAKGYGVDRLGEVLSAAGIDSWLVGIDGEMRARGHKPDGAAWAVGLERPVPGRREIGGVVELVDLAIATSGTYRHFHEIGGTRYSHTIDPLTGAPVGGALASVSVLAPTCMEADAWATAILVDGHWPPRRFPAPRGIEAIME